MLVTKSKAADLAGVSRRTFYNHIPKKRISVSKDEQGVDKIDLSELERVYGKEVIQRNLKKLEDAQSEKVNSVQPSQDNTSKTGKYEILILEEKLKSAQDLIDQLKSERDQWLEDKVRFQTQLDKALEIGAPIGKLLTDQRDHKEGRAVIEREAIEEKIRREAAEKKIKSLMNKIRVLRAENGALKSRTWWKKLALR